MIDIDNKTDIDIDIESIVNIAKNLTSKDIELVVVDSDEMQEINKTQRGIDKDTDVLSFPYDDMPMVPLGSIVISSQKVKQKALELKHSVDDEFKLLFIHGLLHLLGYDHEIDNGEMREMEKKIIKDFNLPDSLIVRNS